VGEVAPLPSVLGELASLLVKCFVLLGRGDWWHALRILCGLANGEGRPSGFFALGRVGAGASWMVCCFSTAWLVARVVGNWWFGRSGSLVGEAVPLPARWRRFFSFLSPHRHLPLDASGLACLGHVPGNTAFSPRNLQDGFSFCPACNAPIPVLPTTGSPSPPRQIPLSAILFGPTYRCSVRPAAKSLAIFFSLSIPVRYSSPLLTAVARLSLRIG
jgi:hypothetical protein